MKYSLFKVSNASGSLELTEITDRPLLRTHLDTNDAFILDLPRQVYVWIGKKANLEEKKNGMLFAKQFIQDKGKPKNTRITRLGEEGEDVLFKSFFEGFYPAVKTDYGAELHLDGQTDIEKVATQQRQASKKVLEKLGSEFKMDVMLVKEGKPEPLEKSEWGHFFSDELYIVDLKGKDHRYVVLWMGPKLDPEKYTETAKYLDIVTNYENSSLITRTRIQRNHEDETFLSLFSNSFLIYLGPIQQAEAKLSALKATGGMFRISAPYGECAKCLEQADVKCSNLNSGDVYLVVKEG